MVAVGVEHPLDTIAQLLGTCSQPLRLEAGINQRRDTCFLTAEQVGEVSHRPNLKLLYAGHWNTPRARWKTR